MNTAERQKRNKAIHAATPDVLDLLLLEQGNVCAMCGNPILCGAEIDHRITVHEFASGPLPIEEAINQANVIENLRAVHGTCNRIAGGKTTASIPGHIVQGRAHWWLHKWTYKWSQGRAHWWTHRR